MNAINKLTFKQVVIANEVKQSQEIATPACRNACCKHFGVQARRFAPRNDYFLLAFTVVKRRGLGLTTQNNLGGDIK